MAVLTQPTLSPSISSRVTKAMTLSPLSFRKWYRSSYETLSSSASPASSMTLLIRKRYRGTFEPILDTKTEGDESEAEGTSSKSEDLEEEGPDVTVMVAAEVVTDEATSDGTVRDAGETSKEPDDHSCDVGV
uniref:Uncharacterized protein n=1 Tax=Tanacetum cinerariifolium TaxID=118510 RepID=A0A699I1K8_TANCI|nr:hypothetical protein [Tanacetum cinerariifolium]